jgi:LysM repeat protein
MGRGVMREAAHLDQLQHPVNPANEPSISPRGDEQSTRNRNESIYIVRAGDVLGRIAAQYRATIQSIQAANSEKVINPDLIYPGEQLIIPAGKSQSPAIVKPIVICYTVKIGDTLGRIAQMFHVTISAIAQANPASIVNLDRIYVGEVLTISYSATATNTPYAGNYPENPDIGPMAKSNLYIEIKQEAMSRYGAEAWPSIVYILSHESGFDPYAINESSGACGLPQSLPCDKLLSSIGSLDNIQGQIDWFFNYIDNRYGGPYGACDFWMQHSWY